MKAKVGLYFFGRNHNSWGIWCYDYVNEETGASSAQKVTNCCTYEEAVRKMYALNGWGEPKNVKRRF